MKSQLKIIFVIFTLIILLINVNTATAQNAVHPTSVSTPVGFAISCPLRDNTVVSYSSFQPRKIPIKREINPNIQPPDFGNMPPDPGIQKENPAG